jgi:isopentenyldiphosphate isomerase/intracellular septation protein A
MDKQSILKNFTIGFIPIIIFIIADELFGTKTGLIVAIAVAILEFAYYYFRYRQVEKFILFDVGLLVILGGVSILLNTDVFFKLKPAFIELIMVILLAIHAFSNKPILLIMGKRYLKDMEINELQMMFLRNISRLLFFIMLAHTILIVYAAYAMSKEAWAFISGGLVYIVFAVIFLGQFLYLKYRKAPVVNYEAEEGEEWFDLVTPEGKITGKAPRSAVHGNPQLLHPVVHIHVFNKNGQLYLQRRSMNKEVQPGKWDTSVGGHILSGENIETALKRESKEELGIKKDNFQPLYRYVFKNDFESELVYTFRITYNGPFTINRDEIAYGRFWSMSEIERNLNKNIFTPNFIQEFQMLKKIKLAKK